MLLFFWPVSSPFHCCLLMLHVKTVVYLQQISLIQGRGILKKAIVRKSKYFLFSECIRILLWFWLWHIKGRFWSFVVCCTLSLFCFLSLFFSLPLSVTVSVLCMCFPPREKSALAEGREPVRAILIPNEEGH